DYYCQTWTSGIRVF
nr:immunoglobulin light chain junction region [Macaca mulatta]MOW00637.1 immunoglobulin light chain junction region [Macaca mulatta]